MCTALCSLSLAAALAGTGIPHAGAQEHSSFADSSTNQAITGSVAGSSQYPGLTGALLDGVVGSSDLLGMTENGFPFRRPREPLAGWPPAVDEGIRQVALVDRRVEDAPNRRERWYIASPAMKRVVQVQVMLPADSAEPSPMLYLLDGIGAPESTSGWVGTGTVQEVFRDENVTAVMPLGAPSSMYTEWQRADPALGLMKWETFLTEELPSVLEDPANGLGFNGRRGIGGLSMGAGAALRMANLHPETFAAAIGISGCYSTMDPMGAAITHLTVDSYNGDVDNMWGPYGSQDWIDNDVTLNPAGLNGTAVYLSAAHGAANQEVRDSYDGTVFAAMVSGLFVERGSMTCTQNLEKSMIREGKTDAVVEYPEYGMHNWTNFHQQLRPGWDAVRHALY